MSIRRRLWNLARAELNELLDRVGSDGARAREADTVDEPAPEGTRPRQDRHRDEVARAYAALELPPGAPWAEVKSAYRRLMRQYHPDRHQGDPAQARIATDLSQQLRDAYELLRGELGER
jgi:DnaJ-domain-containing protein 1